MGFTTTRSTVSCTYTVTLVETPDALIVTCAVPLLWAFVHTMKLVSQVPAQTAPFVETFTREGLSEEKVYWARTLVPFLSLAVGERVNTSPLFNEIVSRGTVMEATMLPLGDPPPQAGKIRERIGKRRTIRNENRRMYPPRTECPLRG